jgi:hypothetical protein
MKEHQTQRCISPEIYRDQRIQTIDPQCIYLNKKCRDTTYTISSFQERKESKQQQQQTTTTTRESAREREREREETRNLTGHLHSGAGTREHPESEEEEGEEVEGVVVHDRVPLRLAARTGLHLIAALLAGRLLSSDQIHAAVHQSTEVERGGERERERERECVCVCVCVCGCGVEWMSEGKFGRAPNTAPPTNTDHSTTHKDILGEVAGGDLLIGEGEHQGAGQSADGKHNAVALDRHVKDGHIQICKDKQTEYSQQEGVERSPEEPSSE